jgi:CRP-like cAMP-binding protein
MKVQSSARAQTLDRLSLPSFSRRAGSASTGEARDPNNEITTKLELAEHSMITAKVKLDDLYGRALRAVPMLSPNTSALADETLFSSVPPALRDADEYSDLALAQRLLKSVAPASRARSNLASVPPALMLEEDYASALQNVENLEAEEALDGSRELELSQAELEPRQPLPVLESARPEPPTAAILADLPLFPLFAALPPMVLAAIVAGSELIELPHAAVVLRVDDEGDALYGIVEGSVNLTVPGQAFELTLAEGDVFGEGCLLEEAKSHMDVVVMGQLTALRIPREVLLHSVEEHPPLAGLVLALLTRRLLGNLLQVSPLFQDFDAAGKASLARLFEVRRVAAGTQLAVAGKKMDGLYISLTGTLDIEETGTQAWSAPPGSMFGQASLLSHTPSGVAISAAVDMIVLRLPAARFSGLVMEHATVLARLAEFSTGEVVRVML